MANSPHSYIHRCVPKYWSAAYTVWELFIVQNIQEEKEQTTETNVF